MIHTSYFPAIHQRLVAIGDRSFLLVWDRICHLPRDEKVEIWYNADTRTATLCPDGAVSTRDEVNFCLRASEGLEVDFLPGMISEHVDAVRPSTRVRLTDSRTALGTRNALSVIVPYRTDRPRISAIVLENDGKTALFTIDGKSYRCVWQDDSFHLEILPERICAT